MFLPGNSHGQSSPPGYTVHGDTRVKHDSVTQQSLVNMLISALSIIARNRTQLECPSAGEWIDKLLYNGMIFSNKKE